MAKTFIGMKIKPKEKNITTKKESTKKTDRKK